MMTRLLENQHKLRLKSHKYFSIEQRCDHLDLYCVIKKLTLSITFSWLPLKELCPNTLFKTSKASDMCHLYKYSKQLVFHVNMTVN